MKVGGVAYRSIRLLDDEVEIIDQTLLPHEFRLVRLHEVEDAARAIRDMQVRGAPLIGATAACGICLAMEADPSNRSLERAAALLLASRPTAVNLAWAVERMCAHLFPLSGTERGSASRALAAAICDEDVAMNSAIGEHGLALLRGLWEQKRADGEALLRILTHCNAGWLATVDWGTALAPIYKAHDAGIPVKVWVDETRPRLQGGLTAWELAGHGVAHEVVADNAGGLLMQRGQVDCCIVGTDRVTLDGDVYNKIGTYLKALAAHDNGIPFYVALPGPTIDWGAERGQGEIPIEERNADEVRWVRGPDEAGCLRRVRLLPAGSPAANPAFDLTPARLVTALITERGLGPASREGLYELYPERKTA